MSDRELLELAAKAAGIEYSYHPGCGDALELVKPRGLHIYWNPLADDGDALRLANAMRFSVYHAKLAVIIKHNQYSWEWMGESINEDSGDRDASTRRAIVRAAAEIGKSQ